MKQYKEDLKYFLNNKVYILCIIVISVISYGFAAANNSVSIDDLDGDRYVGNGNIMLSAGRFGMVFWSKLFGYKTKWPQNSFAIDVIAVVLFILSAVNFCILFYRIAKDKICMKAYTVFSCMLVSYPLMIEIWEYTTANLCVTGGFFFVSIALLIMREQMQGKFKRYCWFISVLLLTIVCASYESLAVVYVFMVFAIFALQILFETERKTTLKMILKHGMIYASVLITGVIFRVVIHRSFLYLFRLTEGKNGDTEIMWGRVSKLQSIKDLITGGIKQYILKGIIYFPITVLLILGLIFIMIGIILCVRKKAYMLLLPGAGMLFSLILLSVIQGSISNYRSSQVFAVFVAFSLMILIYILQDSKNSLLKIISGIVTIASVILCIHQAVYMNYFLTINHLRSEEEANVVRDIGRDLKATTDLNKPVIFTGRYVLSEGITEAVSIQKDDFRWKVYSKALSVYIGVDYEKIYNNTERKLPVNNINSVITWSITAFDSQESMEKLFQYYGFDYKAANFVQIYSEAAQFVNENKIPGYPAEGYIVDRGEYIIVNLG
ncbi:glucosyltransferase domain-containing protein [[Clostridium] hylemonae]|uniref:Glucosyl transferase GtrII n=1 Tax=[Clostridium] hylemonae DSM 15053 TaxID=553973 RepID=C0C2E6_9FIRM|nr:glucosyltransferase domain-containing protein [[Clostridium] hylemonae]EEG73570.1 hypothetical protein CLOHYLEM_06252 [[Clostridium] hylemonae DSM 15053]QEK17172.1 hypothetical protein LAJLEIBI_01181 [[Clostridium] hylemonae DSM 15053]